EDAFRVMHENMIIPAATVILGMPEETPDDVVKTIELVDRLKPYRSVIVPMFFVPMGAFKKNKWFMREHIKQEHIEALKKMYEHTTYWMKDIVGIYMSSPIYAPIRFLLGYFTWYVDRKVKKYVGLLEKMVKK
ncbi:MAG: radical SAM protein, partial [Desulfurococcaceae archaeon]